MGADVEQAKGRLHTGGFLTWGQPFVDLLDHERIMPLLKVILGDGFRLDHYYAIYLEAGAERLGLHGGNTPYDPPEYYHFRNGQMYNGLTVVSWNLADTGPVHAVLLHSGQPQGQLSLSAGNPGGPCRVRLRGGAGGEGRVGDDFTEALTHGTAPWQAAHQRRSLLFKYSPGQQSWSKGHIKPPDGVALTGRQALLFEPPYFHARASLFEEVQA